MLDANSVVTEATALWRKHSDELVMFDRVRGYMRGELGRPTLPDDPDEELRELSRLSVINIMPLVVDTFTDALSVVGFRSPASETDDAAWAIWQREHMDARQSAIYRAACTYGTAYVRAINTVDGTEFEIRSPRRIFAAYDNPDRDAWPVYALETWIDTIEGKKVRRGILTDAEADYAVIIRGSSKTSRVEFVGAVDADGNTVLEGIPHGFSHVPLVRYVNRFDTDDDGARGEVEPLITEQCAINAVNFDRLVVSRFGAFPQKYIFGWAPGTSSDLARMSAKRILAFEDGKEQMDAGAFPSANVTAYNEILASMLAYAAVKARVQAYAITGHFSNVGTDTIALIDSPNQRKTQAKQRSFGESDEQLLRLAASNESIDVPEDAECIWEDTAARSYAQVVDGISKLSAAGVPIAPLLGDVPGFTQQRVDAIADAVRSAEAASTAVAIVNAARGTQPAEPVATSTA